MSGSSQPLGVRIALAESLDEAEGIQQHLGWFGIPSTLDAVVAHSAAHDPGLGIWVSESDAKRATDMIMWTPPQSGLAAREAVQGSRRIGRLRDSGAPSLLAIVLLAITLGSFIVFAILSEVL
jgi:hypothetical protein